MIDLEFLREIVFALGVVGVAIFTAVMFVLIGYIVRMRREDEDRWKR